jgi:hypothetical protein
MRLTPLIADKQSIQKEEAYDLRAKLTSQKGADPQMFASPLDNSMVSLVSTTRRSR